jgi:hypothetical protein
MYDILKIKGARKGTSKDRTYFSQVQARLKNLLHVAEVRVQYPDKLQFFWPQSLCMKYGLINSKNRGYRAISKAIKDR